ncbi:MAG: hydantoinase B/oxoprolinase family protein [Wenzhouxiangella sp.]|jgi:5-oxoprolinase (ATP-hydrolysing)|nr:hydantoinase B/oxoprolinase family protein [Wenzhouxiangella sp.]
MTPDTADPMQPQNQTDSSARWRFWIDRGGTFTDVIGRAPDGRLHSAKLLSDNPEHYQDAAIEGMHRLLEIDPKEPLTRHRIEHVRMGTTVATNTLLERRGEATALLITRGFGDALLIGHQTRPNIFALHIQRPEPLYDTVVEIDERIAADGTIVQAPDEALVRLKLQQLRSDGIRALAVVLVHGYRYPEHELEIGRIAREVGFAQISLSHQVSPLIRLIGRGDTTVVDAYLSPVLRRYADQVSRQLIKIPLQFMKSDGGLTDADHFAGKDAILSGPAGGIIGAVRTTEQAGFDRMIGFDMGGTSTDVSHYRGELERSFETEIAGVRLRVPMLEIHTVAAGGGSRLDFDGSRYRVGPDSAGANPGPACYRKAGPLTVTDCNVMLGKLQPAFFPAVFGSDGDQPLDSARVRDLFEQLATDIQAATGDPRGPEQVAEGFVQIAVANMANAIRKISVQRGHDVTGYTLNCFGGAGGQHACLVAEALGIKTVLIHPMAGVLSAYGMGLADVMTLREFSIGHALDADLIDELTRLESIATQEAVDELIEQGHERDRIVTRSRLHLRYSGTDTTLLVERADLDDMIRQFTAQHRAQFGFSLQDRALVAESGVVEAIASGQSLDGHSRQPGQSRNCRGEARCTAEVRTWMGGREHPQTPVYSRARLQVGQVLNGPAIVTEDHATTVVEPGWQAVLDEHLNLILRRTGNEPSDSAVATDVDPVMLEVFGKLFMAIAEHMGVVLQQTAWSANIKERLDFSCAIFDRQGALIANAPHVPVHLGSMGESVRAVIRAFEQTLQPGDVYLLNDPYAGGTHLPDLTVVSPCFDEEEKLLFFTASRAHHADIGGLTPGSMPPDSRHIDQEGVLISPLRIVRDGVLDEAALHELLSAGPYPARNTDQNFADLRAQIAANARGLGELGDMVDQFSLPVVQAYMGHVQDNAAEQVRRAIAALEDGHYVKVMDTGAQIEAKVTVDRDKRRATIDFSGTSPQQADNFNAPAAITRACVLYVLRSLVADDIPLNDGCMAPVDLIIPEGSLLNPTYPAAVVAGNVETSQVITDTLLAAMGKLANSQGTMNNLTFGNKRYQHYETLCGGAGAGEGFNGADAVHTHMTNSRLTDPEILETRFPVRLEGFGIRPDSGGAGRWRGGHGAERRIRFLEPMTVALLANSRSQPPQGLHGGDSGTTGQAWIEKADGQIKPLKGRDRAEVEPGDALTIRTPGGGGWGRQDS